VRLTAAEIDAIKTAARETFGPAAVVRLFGSRVHDHLKGGDIDLHVEAGAGDDCFEKRFAMRDFLRAKIGERKIDILISEAGRQKRGFERIAVRDGVIL
jgi:predicted nucleotidyltransferase